MNLLNVQSKTIPSLGLSVNAQCNMQCVYCPPYAENMTECSALCPIDDVLRLLDTVRARGLQVARLTGGEPLLTPDRARPILDRCVQLGFEKIILNTNGSRLAEALPWLSRYREHFECKVSLDTIKPDIFRKVTSSDLLGDVLNGIGAAIGEGIQVTINIVLTTLNCDGVFEVLDFCERNNLNAKILDSFDFGGIFPARWQRYYASVDDLVEALRSRYRQLTPSRLPGGRGIEMLGFELQGGRTLLIVNHHGKGHRPKLYCDLCYQCPNYPCATGLFSVALRADGLLTHCRLRPDCGVRIVGLSTAEMTARVADVLAHYDQCRYSNGTKDQF